MSLVEHCIVPDWPAPARVRALQTTRRGGASSRPYDSMNLALHVGDAAMAVERNRMLLSAICPSEPVWLQQVHGTTVANADRAGCLPTADACVATKSASVCVVMTADCLPVLLCDTQGSVVAAAHAGWKGLAAGVIEATIREMQVDEGDLIAWFGPAISQQYFEVGDDVRDAFVSAQSQAGVAFAPGRPGKWHADIYALARQRLEALGVSRIFGGAECTYRDAGRFYSFRRDGATGRMGSFIWLE